MIVLALIFIIPACTTDKSLSNSDYYSTRVVKRKASKEFNMPSFHTGKVKKANSTEVPASTETIAGTLPISQPSQPEINLMVSHQAIDIASVDNNLFINPSKERVTAKIRNLYRTENDAKSFNKGYKEIRQQQVAKITGNNTIADDDTKSQPAAKSGAGFSIASFVVGLVGLLVAGLICGTLAVIFGAIGLKRGKRGLAIAGMIIGIVDVVVVLIALAAA